MTITIHHLEISESERIVWLCEELNLDYNIVIHKRTPLWGPPELKALTPLGTAPVIIDDTFDKQNPLTLAESCAITEWISHKHANGKLFLPSSDPNYATFLYWWHTSNGTIQNVMRRMTALQACVKAAGQSNSENMVFNHNMDSYKHILQLVNDRLGEVPYLAGEEFTVADIVCMYSFTGARKFFEVDLTEYTGILKWLKRLSERPAFVKARERMEETEVGPFIEGKSPDLFDAVERTLHSGDKMGDLKE